MTDKLGLKTQAEKRDEAYERLLAAQQTKDDYEKFGVDQQ